MGGDPQHLEYSPLEEADHRIANHLALLAGFVRVKAGDLAKQSAEPSRTSVTALLESIGVQLDAVARLHRSLATNRPQSSTNLPELLHEICAPFRSGLLGKVQLTEVFEPGCALPLDQLLPVTQIFAEVITNAIKHAHPNGEAGAIHTRCSNHEAGAVLIEVDDDGDGLPETFDPRTDGGLGFRLVRALGKQLGGRVAYESHSRGLHFQLTLPTAAGSAPVRI